MKKEIIIDLISHRNGEPIVVQSFSIDPSSMDRCQVRIDHAVEQFVAERLRKLAKKMLEYEMKQ